MGAHPSSRRIPSLDGLRALSIGLVLLEHLSGTTHFPLSLANVRQYMGDVGSFGVRIFFIISGFLITSLLIEERKKTGRISLKDFYVRRAFRIFPAAYVFLGVVFLLSRFGAIQLLPGDLLAAATYTMNFHQPQSHWLVHLWSLSVEEQFYFLWPAVMLFAGNKGARWFALAQIFLAPVIRVVIWFYFPSHRNFQQFYAVMDSIATGCLLALLKPWLLENRLFVAALRSRLFLLVPLMVLLTMWAAERRFAVYMAHYTIMNVGIALCVCRWVVFPDDRIGWLLNTAPLRFVGTMSYSLYLWQELFFLRGSPSLIESFPVNVGLAFLAALMSFYLIEQPILRLRVRLSRTRTAAVAIPAGPSSTS